MSVPTDTWVPVGLGHGPVCQVCGHVARWMRKYLLRHPDRGLLSSRLWRCDAHAPAAFAGGGGQPCRHHAGPCQTCPQLDQADPLGRLYPTRPHKTTACPRPRGTHHAQA